MTKLALDRLGGLLDSSAALAISHAGSEVLRARDSVAAAGFVAVNSDKALLVVVVSGEWSGGERLWEFREGLVVSAIAGLETGLKAAREDVAGALGAWDRGGESGGREGEGAVDD